MTIAEKIKYFRKQNNLTLLDLSQILNVSTEELLKYESNLLIPDIEIVNKIASYLNISSEEFVLNYGVTKNEKTAKFKVERTFAIIFMLLSYLSVIFGLAIFSIVENDPFQVKHMWVFLLMLPFPITSFVLSILSFRYKDKFVSGMVSGIIMSVFHIALGAIGIPLAMQNDDIYIQNMEYLNELEYLEYTNIDFPEMGKANYTSYEDSIYKNALNRNWYLEVYFDECEKLDDFEYQVKELWNNGIAREVYLLSLNYSSNLDYTYFYLYNITDNSNTINLSARYDIDFIFYEYDINNNCLRVKSYNLYSAKM